MEWLLQIYRSLKPGERALVWLGIAAFVALLAAPGDRRIGPVAGAIIGAVIAGVFTLLGAWMSRWLRRTGAVRCRAIATDSLILGLGGDLVVPLEVGKPGLPLSDEALEWATRGIVYGLSVQFFNERDTNTGLRELGVVFLGDGGAVVQESPLRTTTEAPDGDAKSEEFRGPVPLRSGEFVDLSLETTLAADPDGGKTQMRLCRSAEIRGRFPDGSRLRKTIEFPPSFA